MTIKILPARLANQIAAGEVVERPASVVKELVENSLDAGATRIDIDIEKGGSKLIRVRDNGKGIVKDELTLALSRHATSKIHTLDDLEAIMSLGFRGEALASISSVSRLTFTSRTAAQDQAWSAYSEGRDMDVKVKPAAHPIGTSVEVLDLFFNTPARRKFLRTDKTEFTHIDELLKRIALSRFDVSITLKHNGKVIRQYRAAKNPVQTEKRIAAVCGSGFVRNMLNISLEHNGLKLHGWITSPEGARLQNDLQFCYVNGRMMRDKLINHAIRQSYESTLRPDQYASYVLFIELDPHQVDVNVHPAKHEVRFHQARLVHDFIYQALADALAQSQHLESPQKSEAAYQTETKEQTQNRVMEAVSTIPSYPGQTDYVRNKSQDKERDFPERKTEGSSKHHNRWAEERSGSSAKAKQERKSIETAPSKQELKAYSELLTTPSASEEGVAEQKRAYTGSKPQSVKIGVVGKALSVVAQQYLMAQSDAGEALISLHKAEWYRIKGQLQADKYPLTPQPLLVPLSLKIDEPLSRAVDKYQELISAFGIQLKPKNSRNLMVMAVPQPLRQQNLQQVISDLLSYLSSEEHTGRASEVSAWLADNITQVKSCYTLSEGVQLISELEQLWEGQLPLHDSSFIQPVNFKATIAMFSNK